ncbi:sulfatase [Paenibacillus sp. J5C_2022]|uniref:sulfatase family protein n=1 Tax=Paenibacillus sp. J5C2022 TaxID=2977129 RepID=UPI0021D2FFBD|nr:sulfatase [Paenibacillus sp. J5C2022]MCU6712025.1 sulfatase [Paenibacillus sp. J5C2022]
MNIIYINTHDTGTFIQPYGAPVASPNLMRVAEESVVFRHAFCAAPSCSPSRAALLTGMAPHTCGMLGLSHRGFQLHDYGTHFVQFLQRHGYETILCGFQHEAPAPEMLGYNVVRNPNKPDEISGEGFKAWDLDNARMAVEEIGKSRDKPFFLSFGMMNTHRPFPDIDGAVNPDFVSPPHPVFNNRQNREDTAALMMSVGVVDECVGIVWEALRQSGKEDDTLLIFTTDHGIPFPRMKCHLYDTGIGVALMMRMPGGRWGGKAVDGLVSQIDLFPTICELTGLEMPKWLQGTSMLPLIEGSSEAIRTAIYSEQSFHIAYDPARCIRTDRYKLIQFFDGHGRIVHIGGDGGATERFVSEHGILEEDRAEEMLFDLFLDPVERVNLVHDARYRDIYADLAGRLEAWMKGTNDPLLHGRIEPSDAGKLDPPWKLNPNIPSQ